MRVYCFPGLGADKRMYEFLLSHSEWNATVLELLKPNLHESISDYAMRYLDKIDRSEPFALIGTSLGGMIAVELSKVVHPQKLVIISSLKSTSEKPWLVKMQKIFPLYKLLKGRNYKQLNQFYGKVASSSKKNNIKSLITDMGEKTDDFLIEWAVDQVIHWNNEYVPENLLQLHGDKDLLFPPNRIAEKKLIRGGSHIMILTHSNQIYQKIEDFFAN